MRLPPGSLPEQGADQPVAHDPAGIQHRQVFPRPGQLLLELIRHPAQGAPHAGQHEGTDKRGITCLLPQPGGLILHPGQVAEAVPDGQLDGRQFALIGGGQSLQCRPAGKEQTHHYPSPVNDLPGMEIRTAPHDLH